MNDQNDLRHLDERADTAAADVRRQAEGRARPAFDPDRAASIEAPAPAAPGHRRTRALIAVAAAVVLLIGGAAWWTARPDGDDPSPVTSTGGSIRPFVATDLPDGFQIAGAGQYDQGDQSSSLAEAGTDGRLTMYGPDVTDPGLGIAYIRDFTTDGLGEGAEKITVAGRPAYTFDGKGLGVRAVILPESTGAVLLTSPTLERADLVRLAALVTVHDGNATAAENDLPSGWHEVGIEPSVASLSSPFGAMSTGTGSGRFAVYSKGDTYAMISIAVIDGDQSHLYAPALVLTDTEPVTVNGHPGIVGTPQRSQSASPGQKPVDGAFVSWMAQPGELVRVTSYGISRAELLKVAEAMRPAGAAEWKDLIERSQLGEFDPGRNDGSKAMGSGTFPSGVRWLLRLTPASSDSSDGASSPASVSLAVTLTGDSSSGSNGSSGSGSGQGTEIGPDGKPITTNPFQGTEVLQQGGHTFASGLIGDQVKTIELRRRDGSKVGLATIVEKFGHRAFVAEATDGAIEAVALDASGRELGRTDVGTDATGTGSEQTTTLVPDMTAPDPIAPTTVGP